jgi:Hypothetical protein (DUF2513)
VKRDLDLIRRILIAAEGIDPNEPYLPPTEFSDVDSAVLGEHFKLMTELDLVEASWSTAVNGVIVPIGIMRLKNPGHDFLAAIRNETIWEKTKVKIKDSVGTTTLELVKVVATGLASSSGLFRHASVNKTVA